MSVSTSSVARLATDQMFAGLDGVLRKGAAAARSKGVDEGVYLNWRLAPDMLPLTRQVQFATEIPAREHIKGLPSAPMDADPDGEIKVPMGKEERVFTRINFLQHFILPNLYFHTTTTYLILRHLGVDIGKLDFMAAPPR